jgi:hypothetical protein
MAYNTRTDAHRPSTIIPANYEQWNDYALASSAGGWPTPSMGISCKTDRVTCLDTGRCCVVSTERHARAEGRAVYGSAGRCGVCGANYTYGTMFRHEPTGEIVHMGHDCARKYEMLADWTAFELGLDRARKTAGKVAEQAKNDAERREFLDAHPGLEDAFTVEHRIISDIKARFVQWRSVSDKQVALVLKIANEIRNPPTVPVEINVPAPTGRVTFTGVIMSAKVRETDFGSDLKITVKVQAEGGVWLAWLTAPRGLCDAVWEETKQPVSGQLKGRTVTLTATLKPGRESHFAFGSRPAYGAPVAKARKPRKSKAEKAVELTNASVNG